MSTKTREHPVTTDPDQRRSIGNGEPCSPGDIPDIQQQAAEVVMPLAAGYVGHRTIAIGLRQGLLEALAGHPGGLTAEALAGGLGFDPFYVSVWCRAGFAAGFLEHPDEAEERYALGPRDARILDTACGTGFGLVRLATTYPDATVVGADGDAHSLDVARERVVVAGLDGRVELLHTPLEDLEPDGEFALITNNISMHECRDPDRVTANIRAALEPGGRFVISDIPFPDTTEDLQTTPGRVMSGVQFWEAQIDDQLLPRDVYDDLLARHGFSDIGSFELAPIHAVTYGTA